MRRLILLALLPLGACAAVQPPPSAGSPVVEAALPPARPETLDPTPPPPPPPAADTAEELDTTTEEDRAEAVAPPTPEEAAGERRLGTTVATLGSPTDPGIWMETPLVSELTMGRIEYPVAGTSVAVELRPSGGDPGSGSEISLAAMRLLEAPLTGLPELVVYGG